MRATPITSALDGYDGWHCSGEGADALAFPVYEGAPTDGAGPALVLLHELPGLGASTLTLAARLRDEGYHVWLPCLFGEPGRDQPWRGLVRICVRAEMRALARSGRTPLSDWVRDLVDHVTPEGEGAGVIGMCMTGGLVLSQVVQPGHRVAAGVAAQPSMPARLPLRRGWDHRDLGLTDAERDRAAADDTPLLALRFATDPISTSERMDVVREVFGTEPCTADDAHGALEATSCGRLRTVTAPGSGHATLTAHADRTGGATVAELLDFLAAHLPAPG